MSQDGNNRSSSTARDGAKNENLGIRRKNRHGGAETPDWESANAELLQRAIGAVTHRKCAIMFGYTRDGATYSVRIVGDGDAYNEYVRPPEDIDVYLGGLIEDFGMKAD